MFLLWDMKQGGVRLTCNGMSWSGVCHDEVILGASDPPESLSPMNYSATLYLFLQTLLMSCPGWLLSLREDEGTPTSVETPATNF